ncbi:MAG: hypothetical protein Q4A39_05750 [Eubacteriales bacterium]|nr:hypothetical protein [Eubacteriales bacterium]
MKKRLSTVVTVLALVIAVISQFRISALQDEIRQLENHLNSSISIIQTNQSTAISYMEQLMEQEASILTHTVFDLGEMELTDKTFVLRGSVTPKEHQPGVTEAFLTVNGEAYAMELMNGAYTVRVDLPLFEEVRVDKVEFREGNTIRTELLEEQRSPRYELLPRVNGRFGGSGSGSAANGIFTWCREGEVSISVEGKGQVVDVRSVSLIEELDGVEVGRTEIPLTNTESGRGYNAEPEPAPHPSSGFRINGSETFYYPLDREFKIPFGSTLELLAEVEDGNGLCYRAVLDHWTVSESGENVDDNLWGLRNLFEQILDADGNILYEVNEEDYR